MLRSIGNNKNQANRLVKGIRLAYFKRSMMSNEGSEHVPVQFTVQDTARIVTLNRPKKLNALNTKMCDSIFNTLSEYAKSKATNLIIFNSSNQPRSLCAGGDVATIALNNLNGKVEESIRFFQSEYSMNFLMATYPKPIVVFMDGITMGGGVGLSIHTPFRIATENTQWAMPEMDIGFFPDVGTTFALPRIITLANKNSQLATYLCLTGDIISGEDAYIFGLASHYIPETNLKELQQRLGELHYPENIKINVSFFDMVNKTIEEYSTPLPKDYKLIFTNSQLTVIEECFNINENQTIDAIIRRLEKIEGTERSQFATRIKKKLLSKSYTSLQVALKLLQENSKDNIESALKRDLFTATNMCNDTSSVVEFSQSVKHKLVDKNQETFKWTQNDDLSTSQLVSLISPKPSMLASIKKNITNVTWNDYPNHAKYQLPNEEKVLDYIKKATENEKNIIVSKEDVVKYFSNFNNTTKGKAGIEYICKLICDRKYSMNGN